VKRSEHTFLFSAADISKAAKDEAEYHESRVAYWQEEYDKAVAIVEVTAGARVDRRPVTGGYEVDVVVDYGDPAAYQQMRRSFQKINSHREEAETFRTDERVYGSQDSRMYELDSADVHHFRLGGEPRED